MLPRRRLALLALFAILPLTGCVMQPPFAASRTTPAPIADVALSPAALEAVAGGAVTPDENRPN